MGINCEICDKDCGNYYLFSELYNMCPCVELYDNGCGCKLDKDTSRKMYYFVNGAYCTECYENGDGLPPLPKCPMCKKEVTRKHN